MEPRDSIARMVSPVERAPVNDLQRLYFALPEGLQLLLAVALFLGLCTSGLKVLYELGRWLAD